MAFYELLRTPMRAWYQRMLAHAPYVANPRAGFFVGEPGPEADRVLIVGNGPVHGWGVLTHELSLVGHLAGGLRARTGRDAGVEFVGDERMNARSAITWLGERAADGYDLAIIAVGMNDALRLTPVAEFAADYRLLVERVRADLPEHGRVVLVTLPHVRRYQMASGGFGRWAERHAARLSAVIRESVVGVRGAVVVEAPDEHFEPQAPLGSRAFFEDLAGQLVERVAPVLDAARAERRVAPGAFVLPATRVLASRQDATLDRLVADAQQRFGVAVAAVNLVDGDRIWCAALAGGALPPQMPGPIVYCGVVAGCDDELVVPDRYKDSRFDGNPFLDVVDLPFYAGVPLHDPAGAVIGALCMLDSRPRPAGYVSMPALRLVAAEAEARLAERLDERATEALGQPA